MFALGWPTPLNMILGFILLSLSLECVACSMPSVSCTIINLQHIDCVWNVDGIPEFNYTFYSRLKEEGNYSQCPSYLLMGGHTVGCKLPYIDKFARLFSYLSLNNRSSGPVQVTNLEKRVKLLPPHGLSVKMPGSSELWLSWNISARASPSCLGSEVSYRKDSDSEEKMTGELSGKSFSLPFPSERSRYTFKVRVRVTESCLQSAWSDWSSPVYWGPKKLYNSTSTEAYGGNSIGWLPYTLALVCFAAVVTGFIFVFQNERLRVILIPVVPKPGKTLDELLNTYNGNVEDWLNISPDFAEGFKPSFSEPACQVREYSLIPQRASSSSADSVPDLQDESDSFYKSCSTNSSSISASPEDTPPGLV